MKAKGKPFNLEAFLAQGNGGTTIRKHKTGDTIFTQGDTCDGVFYIREGSCKITVVSERGKEAVAALHEKGDFFGEGCLTGQLCRLATAIAMTDCELLKFDKATIQRVIHEQPDFAELFIAHLLVRNTRVEADLVDLLFNSSEKRLARLLLLMANFGKDGKAEPIKAKISQATLAEMASQHPARGYYEITLLALEQALKDVWQVLRAHDFYRDWDRDPVLKRDLAQTLMALADTGVRNRQELRRRTLATLDLDPSH